LAEGNQKGKGQFSGMGKQRNEGRNEGMNCKLETITPKIAQKYLSTVSQEKQRKLSERTVDRFSHAMRLGNWVLTHQGIAFDEAGNLCDGQHRMAAVVSSGVSIQIMVTRDMPEKQGNVFTFDAIDRGSVRGIGQQLQVRHGIKDANCVAGAARTIACLCARTTVTLTVETTLAIYDRFGESLCFTLSALRKTHSLITCPVLGTLAFCHRAMPKELDDFICRVGDGDGVRSGQPAFALRRFLLDKQNVSGKYFMGRGEKAAALCAMHHVTATTVKQIKSSFAGIDFFSDKQPRIVEEVRMLVL
jgi:hypothetical protein